jgi:hypothetical protein
MAHYPAATKTGIVQLQLGCTLLQTLVISTDEAEQSPGIGHHLCSVCQGTAMTALQ